MEVSVLVTVGYGDAVEILMGASVGHQSVQRSLQLSTTWSQGSLWVLPGVVASLIGGFGGVAGQGLLDAALVLGTAADVAVIGVLRDDLILPVHR